MSSELEFEDQERQGSEPPFVPADLRRCRHRHRSDSVALRESYALASPAAASAKDAPAGQRVEPSGDVPHETVMAYVHDADAGRRDRGVGNRREDVSRSCPRQASARRGPLVDHERRTDEMSSHREAPEISQDPVADNTDTYAFVSPDQPDTVTILANYIPLEAAAAGPNFYQFGEDVRYRHLHLQRRHGRGEYRLRVSLHHARPGR